MFLNFQAFLRIRTNPYVHYKYVKKEKRVGGKAKIKNLLQHQRSFLRISRSDFFYKNKELVIQFLKYNINV
jgi:hypothetical protein